MKSTLLFVCGVVGSVQAARAFQVPSDDGPKALTAVTFVERETSGELGAERMVAVRGDGAKAVVPLPTGRSYTGYEARSITLPEEGRYLVVADAIRAVSTFYRRPQPEESARAAVNAPRCQGSDDLVLQGDEMMLGVVAYRYQRASGATQFQMRDTIWMSPELGCHPLKLVSEQVDAGGMATKHFERVVLSVRLGEPEAQLFAVPADYREMAPSQANRELIERRYGRKFGSEAADAQLLSGFRKMDANYYGSRPARP